MQEVDLLIFDLDGTLASTGQDLANSVNYSLKTLGLPSLDPALIISFVGDGIRELMIRSLGPEHKHRIDEGLEAFQSHHNDHILDHTVLYPGVMDVLQYFQHKKKIVLSNKRQVFVEIIVRALAIDGYFDRIIGGDTYPYMKPDARLIDDLLRDYPVPPERAVIIGDGRNDILLAQSAGILSCAFLNGLTQRDLLLSLKPDLIFEDMAELKTFFS